MGAEISQLPVEFDVPAAARADRLERQVAALHHELERRIDMSEKQLEWIDALEREIERLRIDLDRVMASRSMRLLRVPRAHYARLRGALGRSSRRAAP